MGRRGPPKAIGRTKLNEAAALIRRSYPHGIDRGALTLELDVNPSTWRTGGYEDRLRALHPDLYVERGRWYNDGERTAILVSLRAAEARGERAWARELRQKWDDLREVPRGQTTLEVEEEP